jgi:hypothetical protein
MFVCVAHTPTVGVTIKKKGELMSALDTIEAAICAADIAAADRFHRSVQEQTARIAQVFRSRFGVDGDVRIAVLGEIKKILEDQGDGWVHDSPTSGIIVVDDVTFGFRAQLTDIDMYLGAGAHAVAPNDVLTVRTVKRSWFSRRRRISTPVQLRDALVAAAVV